MNHHRFPDAFTNPNVAHLGPVIYLLFRPDHYDILYRRSDQTGIMAPESDLVYQVNRVEVLPPGVNIDDAGPMGAVEDMPGVDFGLLSNMLPNFFNVVDSNSMMSQPVQSPPSDMFTTQPTGWVANYEEGVGTTSSTAIPSSTTRASSNPSTPMSPISASSQGGSARGPAGAGETGPRASSAADCRIRFSNAQYDYDEISNQFKVQTSTFRNSVYNTAHYRNPNFHPEECHPDGEPFERRSSTGDKKRQGP